MRQRTNDKHLNSSLLSSLAGLYPLATRFLPKLALGVLAALLAAAIKLGVPQALHEIANRALEPGSAPAGLWIGVGVVAVLGILEALLVSLRRRLVVAPGSALEAELRIHLYRHLTELPASFHDRWTGGQLLSRSISDIRRFMRWLSFGLTMTTVSFVTLAVGMTLLLVTDWRLGLVYLAAALPAFAVSLRARGRYTVLSRRSQDQNGDLGTTIEESVQGIRVLKAYGREQEALEDFSDRAAELKVTEIGKARQRASITLVMASLPDAALAVVLVVGVFQVANGSLSTGALLAFFATATILAGPLERLADQFAMSMDAKTAIDRYQEVMRVPVDLTDPAEPTPIPEGPGRLVLESVGFHHPGGPAVLDRLDLEILPGETLALVGLTGSGKSTLAQLVPRFYDVDEGSVRIDGTDVRDLARHDLRRLVAIAFSDPVLFSTTVRENLALGRPDATDDEVRLALEVARATFVDQLPRGLDTPIGEEGASLSGGQRQRISLARAILARPRVLVLDDPLSALDVRTEAAVAARLREHLAGTTTLVVANRPSTVNVADRIAVLDQGRIAALGTHEELFATSAIYRTILSGETGEPQVDPAMVSL